LVSPGLSGLGKGFWYSVVIFLPRHSFLIPFVVSLVNHPLSWSFDKLRVTVTQIILVRWDHRVYTGNPILHGDPFYDKAQELLTLVEGQGG